MTAPAFILTTAEELRAIVRAEVQAAMSSREPDPLLTAAEAAEILGVTPRTLRNYEARGMPVARVSARVVRYRRAEIEAWARRRCNG